MTQGIVPTFDPDTGASGGPAPGGVGTSPVVASTLAAFSTQSNGYSFAPTLSLSSGTAGGTWLTTITRVSDGSSVSVTGGTSTTPTATLNVAGATPGDSFRCHTVYTDPDGLTDEYTSVVFTAGVGGGAWTDIWSAVFSSNVTDKTLTKGAAASILYESDGTTPIITLRYLARTNSGPGSCVCTAASGKLLITNDGDGSSGSDYVYGQLNNADNGIDWDSGTIYAIDFVLSGIGLGSNGDSAWIVFGTSASGIKFGQNVGIRFNRNSSTSFDQNGRRYYGAAVNGVDENSQASQPTTAVVRIIIYYGTIVTVYWQTGTTTRLTGIPTEGGGVNLSEMGVDNRSVGSYPGKFNDTTNYFFMDVQNTSTGAVSMGMEAVYIQKFA
jgi:hypothetical protein